MCPLVCDMARVRFYVSFVASLVPCDMSGFMEMFDPQGSVGFMCVLSLFVPDICFRFVVTSLVSWFASLRRIYS